MGRHFSRLRRAIWRHKYFWTLLIFGGIVGFLDPNSLVHRHQLRADNEALREEIAQYDKRYAEDSRALHELQSSQDAIENVARVRLFMKTDNEDLYIIEEE